MAFIEIKPMDYSCVFSALLFLVGNLLITISYFEISNSISSDFRKWINLDAEYIEERITYGMNHYRSLILAGEIMVAIAWFFFTIPIMQLSWVLSRGGKRKLALHTILIMLVVGGSLTELIARLLQIGMRGTMHWVSNTFNLSKWISDSESDNIGWKMMGISELLISGMMTWVDTFEWFAMFGISTIIVISVETLPKSTRVFSLFWSRLGILLALCCIVELSANILRMYSWRRFSSIARYISLFTTTILLPAWLLLLASWLPLATPTYNEKEDDFFINTRAIQTPTIDRAEANPDEKGVDNELSMV